jgi:hypothetical protein
VSKLGVGRQGPNYLTGGHLDGGKVVIAVGDGVRDVIKEGNIEMTIVCISLDNLHRRREHKKILNKIILWCRMHAFLAPDIYAIGILMHSDT